MIKYGQFGHGFTKISTDNYIFMECIGFSKGHPDRFTRANLVVLSRSSDLVVRVKRRCVAAKERRLSQRFQFSRKKKGKKEKTEREREREIDREREVCPATTKMKEALKRPVLFN